MITFSRALTVGRGERLVVSGSGKSVQFKTKGFSISPPTDGIKDQLFVVDGSLTLTDLASDAGAGVTGTAINVDGGTSPY